MRLIRVLPRGLKPEAPPQTPPQTVGHAEKRLEFRASALSLAISDAPRRLRRRLWFCMLDLKHFGDVAPDNINRQRGPGAKFCDNSRK